MILRWALQGWWNNGSLERLLDKGEGEQVVHNLVSVTSFIHDCKKRQWLLSRSPR